MQIRCFDGGSIEEIVRTPRRGIRLTGWGFRSKVAQHKNVESAGVVVGAGSDQEVGMRFKSAVSLASIILAVAISFVASAGEPSLEGSFTANGKEVELTNVYVYPEKEGFYDSADPTWTLLFTTGPIAERDLDDHIWDAAYIRLGITETSEFTDEPEITVYSQDIRFAADQPGNISGGSYPELEVTAIGPEGFQGRVWHAEEQEFFDDTFQYDLTFSAPMSDPSAPIGDPLPAGGGEPGAAYAAWCEAIHSGDVERIKAVVPAEQADMLDDPSLAAQFAEDLEFMQLMTPENPVIVGGSSDGETAILEVTATMEGEAVTGEITMTKMGDRWVNTDSSWE
jgi:hypothetical protein